MALKTHSLEFTGDVAAKLLEVRVSGKLTAEDYEAFRPAVDELIEEAGKVRILFIMHDFHGWELGAAWEDMKFGAAHFRDIDRIAMVGDKAWEKWMSVICKPFTLSTVRYFDAEQEEEARQWLAEQ
jgi:hypothetical protein